MRILLDSPSSMRLDARDAALVAGKRVADVVEKAAVDLEMISRWRGTRTRSQRERPLLQRLGQQRVVRVGERPPRQVPRLVPAETRLVEEDPHQLGDRERRVGVVELDGDLFGKRLQSALLLPEAADDVGQRAGDEEVLLDEAQPLPVRRRVVGIEDARERLGRQRLGERADEVAAAELLEVEVVGGRRGPETQRVDRLAAVADDGPVVGDADSRTRGPSGITLQAPAPCISNGAVELDLHLLVRAGDLPGVGPAEPVVRLLALPAVLDRLAEDAVLVAQPVAHGRDLHRRQRVEEAGGQAPEPAVAEAGVRLLLERARPVEAASPRGSLDRAGRAGGS